ncbi:predicted protein [Sclerotinia sclerotiorum 1980 UF-70]|uniref:Uncharacterized protein n=1 Tax=Sclerotinia sclerotiorum (strain ATCC 18683 / 1980 / Ss-1) TaxID=665079 RepID=A7F4M9_SCLS1|nr:predicted protein [Sclerotinia sclerotiorum 1980 UF-70]EDN97700.1 predicted protein [Sclerotinia sclerotiorum 1980 UF-70]
MCRVSQISRWLKTRVYDSSQKLGGHRVKGLCCGWAIDEMLFVGGYQICTTAKDLEILTDSAAFSISAGIVLDIAVALYVKVVVFKCGFREEI